MQANPSVREMNLGYEPNVCLRFGIPNNLNFLIDLLHDARSDEWRRRGRCDSADAFVP